MSPEYQALVDFIGARGATHEGLRTEFGADVAVALDGLITLGFVIRETVPLQETRSGAGETQAHATVALYSLTSAGLLATSPPG